MKYIWLVLAVLLFLSPILITTMVDPVKWISAVMICVVFYYVHWAFDLMQQSADRKDRL